jgi:hypothetical protein
MRFQKGIISLSPENNILQIYWCSALKGNFQFEFKSITKVVSLKFGAIVKHFKTSGRLCFHPFSRNSLIGEMSDKYTLCAIKWARNYLESSQRI